MKSILLLEDGDSVKGKEVKCPSSQTSRYNLRLGPSCSITYVFPNKKADQCINQTSKQTNKQTNK